MDFRVSLQESQTDCVGLGQGQEAVALTSTPVNAEYRWFSPHSETCSWNQLKNTDWLEYHFLKAIASVKK